MITGVGGSYDVIETNTKWELQVPSESQLFSPWKLNSKNSGVAQVWLRCYLRFGSLSRSSSDIALSMTSFNRRWSLLQKSSRYLRWLSIPSGSRPEAFHGMSNLRKFDGPTLAESLFESWTSWSWESLSISPSTPMSRCLWAAGSWCDMLVKCLWSQMTPSLRLWGEKTPCSISSWQAENHMSNRYRLNLLYHIYIL